MGKILGISNYDKRSFGKVRLILIWEELLRLDSHLAISIWEDQDDFVRI